MTPHAPCTQTCMRNEPSASIPAVCDSAKIGTIGSAEHRAEDDRAPPAEPLGQRAEDERRR